MVLGGGVVVTKPSSHEPLIPRDLDWIVSKSIIPEISWSSVSEPGINIGLHHIDAKAKIPPSIKVEQINDAFNTWLKYSHLD